MQTVTWTPELQQAVRSLKKFDKYQVASFLKEQHQFLTRQEQRALSDVFSKPEIHKARINSIWV